MLPYRTCAGIGPPARGPAHYPGRMPGANERARADAAANRERLLVAAGDLIAERGVAVPLQEISKRAGVGPGTFYRNFSDRHELLMALADRMRARFEGALAAAAAASTGWGAIERFVDGVWQLYIDMPWVAAVRAYSIGRRPTPPEWEDVIAAFVQRAHDEGSLRPGVELTDIVFLPTLFAGFVGYPEPVRSIVVQRQRAIVLDGIRAHGAAVRSAEGALPMREFRSFVDLPPGENEAP
jgi:AcrR family transcriptional regulator